VFVASEKDPRQLELPVINGGILSVPWWQSILVACLIPPTGFVSGGELAIMAFVMSPFSKVIVGFIIFFMMVILLDRRDQRGKPEGSQRDHPHPHQRQNYTLNDAITLAETYVNEERAERAKQGIHNRSILCISVITLVVVGIYTTLTYKQWTATEASFTEVQRAFVFVRKIGMETAEIQSQGRWVQEFYPEWENSGTTPADEVRLYSHIEGMDTPLTPNYNFGWKEGYTFLLAPKSTIEGIHGWVPAEDVERFRKPWSTYHIVVYAEARYKDIFGKDHWTEACTDVTGVRAIDPHTNKITLFQTIPCNYYNCEDNRCPDAADKRAPHDTLPAP
jgi:hypothetical protein